MPLAINPKAPCSDQSRAVGEPIGGSALTDVDAWLLIEYRGGWTADIADVELPDAARAWLTERGRKHRRLRTQLIKGGRDQGPLAVYVVLTGARARIRRFALESHAELPSIDVDGLLSGERDSGAPGPQAIYLVCTHGRRDRCCALHGVALWQAMSKLDLEGCELWQSSHQGGHRFAATMLYLPAGLHYGRLLPEEARALFQAHQRGELYDLARYRGQTRYGAAVQTMEAWLRQDLEAMRIADVELLGSQLEEGERWTGRFRTHDDMLHKITAELRSGEHARRTSCTSDEMSPPRYYYVVRHEAQTT
jgi:hypothetical protein